MFFFFPHVIFQHILHFPVVKILAQPHRSHYCSKTAARANIPVVRFPSPLRVMVSGVQVTETGVTLQLVADFQALALGKRYMASAGSQLTAPKNYQAGQGPLK